MITENDIHLKDAAEKMYELSADEMIQQRCRARNDYMKQVNTHNRTLRELEETQKELIRYQNENEQLKKRIIELESQQN